MWPNSITPTQYTRSRYNRCVLHLAPGPIDPGPLVAGTWYKRGEDIAPQPLRDIKSDLSFQPQLFWWDIWVNVMSDIYNLYYVVAPSRRIITIWACWPSQSHMFCDYLTFAIALYIWIFREVECFHKKNWTSRNEKDNWMVMNLKYPV